MKLVVTLLFFFASLGVGLGLVLTVIDADLVPGWLGLACIGAGLVLGVAAVFGARGQRERRA